MCASRALRCLLLAAVLVGCKRGSSLDVFALSGAHAHDCGRGWIVYSDSASLWRQRPDGTDRQQVTPTMTEEVRCPRWSPDGERIAYLLDGTDETTLHLIDADGTGDFVSARIPHKVLGIAWARDGQTIAYVAEEPTGGTIQLFVLPGLGPFDLVEQITATPERKLGHLAFSPDGASILCVEVTTDEFDREIAELWLVARDRSFRQLFQRLEGRVTGLSWSPDGQQIAVARHFNLGTQQTEENGDERSEVLVLDPTGFPLGHVPVPDDADQTTPPLYSALAWSPDSGCMAYGVETILGIALLPIAHVFDVVTREDTVLLSALLQFDQQECVGVDKPSPLCGAEGGPLDWLWDTPPLAFFSVFPAHPLAGDVVTLDAGDSTDDMEIVEYAWDFTNDGTFDLVGDAASAAQPMLPFSAAGTYAVRLRVTDNIGQTGETVQNVTISLAGGGGGGGGLIVFSNTPSGGYSDIYTINPSAGFPTRLTNNGNVFDDDPAWSPDRTRIAFVSNRVDPAHVNFDVVVMNADGSNPQPLTDFTAMATLPPFAPAMSAFDPAWSPGGTKIAVTAGRTGFAQTDIWVIDLANGNQVTQLTQGGSGDRSPTWSLSGTEIAFSRNGLIYKVAADGMSAPVQVALPTAEFVDSPDWGPAGFAVETYLLISHDQPIWQLDPFSAPQKSVRLSSGSPDRVPSWSPDSQSVVFVREGAEGGPSEKRLWTVPVGNSNGAVEVPGQPAGANDDPDWGFPPLP